eukprot:jgi/Mesvir1/21227/Mv06663-RA.1
MAAFERPRLSSNIERTRHLYCTNIGPCVGMSLEQVTSVFETFGRVEKIVLGAGARLYITMSDEDAAEKALQALHERPVAALNGRTVRISYAQLAVPKGKYPILPVHSNASDLHIPGLALYHDFVTPQEEQALLDFVDAHEWVHLAKRRVQHHGFAFDYQTRNVDPGKPIPGGLPTPFRQLADRIQHVAEVRMRDGADCAARDGMWPLGRASEGGASPLAGQGDGGRENGVCDAAAGEGVILDQVTVNEYLCGVGLAPHVDTHSAFRGAIVSLSLAGHTVMELRLTLEELGVAEGGGITGGGGGVQGVEVEGRGCGGDRPAGCGSGDDHSVHPASEGDGDAGSPGEKHGGSARQGSGRCQQEGDAGEGAAATGPNGVCEGEADGTSSTVSLPGGEASRRALLLPPRSLLVLSGEARYRWQHYIPHRKADTINGVVVPRSPRRVSLTFRSIRKGPCCCGFPRQCDSQQLVLSQTRMALEAAAGVTTGIRGAVNAKPLADSHGSWPPLEPLAPAQSASSNGCAGCSGADASGSGAVAGGDGRNSAEPGPAAKTSAPKLVPGPLMEREYVHAVYNAIAPHFSATRYAPWPQVAQFLKSLPAGSVVADAGCGNGKYLGVCAGLAMLGSDISDELMKICARRGFDVVVADSLALPYRTNCCDAAISVAVLHHISSEARRRAAIIELLRVVRPGGRVLVTVWAQEQENPDKTVNKWTPLDMGEGEDIIQHGDTASHTGQGDAQQESVQQHAPQGTQHEDAGPRWAGGGRGAASPAEDLDTDARDPSAEMPVVDAAVINGVPVTVAGRPQDDGSVTISDPASQATMGAQQEGTDGSESGAPSTGKDYFVPWQIPSHRVGIFLASAMAKGMAAGSCDLVKGDVVFRRYYHVYVKGELERLVASVDGAVLERSFFDCSNWCVIISKTHS